MPTPPRPGGASNRPSYRNVKRPSAHYRRPPSSLDAARKGGSHEVYVQIASLQMARVRKQTIRASLQEQIDQCDVEIERIDRELRERYQQANLAPQDAPEPPTSSSDGGSDGFEYEY